MSSERHMWSLCLFEQMYLVDVNIASVLFKHECKKHFDAHFVHPTSTHNKQTKRCHPQTRHSKDGA